jgi:hypothetical protein
MASAPPSASSQATQIELVMKEFPWHFHDTDSSGSDDGELVAEIYSDELTTRDEMESWVLGMVPYRCAETLRRELKVFQIMSSTDASVSGLSEQVLHQMFEESDFSVLRDPSLDRLRQMMEYYVPKYFTSFMNTEIRKAEFLVGLTDDGEVTGVIVPSTITQSDVRTMVWSRVEATIRSQVPAFGGDDVIEHYVQHIRQALRVEMVELDPDVSMMEDWSEDFLRSQKAKIDEYQSVRRVYLSKMSKISRLISHYRRGIDEFVEFIQTHIPDSSVSTDIGADVREAIVDRVRRLVDEPMTFAPGQILDEKSDVRNMAYWITKFRDLRVDEIRASKPQIPMGSRPSPLYTSLMIRNPVHRLISGVAADPSSQMKVVVIHIEFPGRLSIPFPPGRDYHRCMSYTDLSGTYKTSVRYITSNGPSCM